MFRDLGLTRIAATMAAIVWIIFTIAVFAGVIGCADGQQMLKPVVLGEPMPEVSEPVVEAVPEPTPVPEETPPTATFTFEIDGVEHQQGGIYTSAEAALASKQYADVVHGIQTITMNGTANVVSRTPNALLNTILIGATDIF